MLKLCSSCNEEKPLELFSYCNVCNPCRSLAAQKWNKENPERASELRKDYELRNKQKRRLAAKEQRLQDPERFREYDRRSRLRRKDKIKAYMKTYQKSYRLKEYNISVDQYDKLMSEQNNLCAICSEPFIRTPHIDHDHRCCPTKEASCGKCIRGLLCGSCNRALGLLKESVEIVKKASSYLEKYETMASLSH